MSKDSLHSAATAKNDLKPNSDEQQGTKNNKVKSDRYDYPGDTGGGTKGPTRQDLPTRMYGDTD